MKRNLLLIWGSVMVAVMVFICIRVIVPGLVNLQNDGALILAFLVAGAALTAPFVFYHKVVRPLMKMEPKL